MTKFSEHIYEEPDLITASDSAVCGENLEAIKRESNDMFISQCAAYTSASLSVNKVPANGESNYMYMSQCVAYYSCS